MAPGKVEDNRGVPFVGPAGTLLRNELRRQSIDPSLAYYMNVVCCMPPENRVKANHIDACRVNLKDQLDTADCEWVLVCGSTALEALMPNAGKYAKDRSIHIHGLKVWPIYHPSYILRVKDGGATYKQWQDSISTFGMAMMGIEFEVGGCVYCGEDVSRPYVYPVCSKCMGKWKVDRKWRYTPPPQMSLDL